MRLMALGHVLVDRSCAGRRRELRAWEATRLPRWKISTVVAVKRASSCLPGELIRNAVVVPVDLDVIVDVGADRFPFRQSRSARPAGAAARAGRCSANKEARVPSRLRNGRLIQPFQQFVDGLIEFGH